MYVFFKNVIKLWIGGNREYRYIYSFIYIILDSIWERVEFWFKYIIIFDCGKSC